MASYAPGSFYLTVIALNYFRESAVTFDKLTELTFCKPYYKRINDTSQRDGRICVAVAHLL